MPLVIGLTGSIATGKSLLSEHLVKTQNAIHANADTLVHRMYDPGTEGFDRIVLEFGTDVVGSDGYIDRKIIGSKVFGNFKSSLLIKKNDINKFMRKRNF